MLKLRCEKISSFHFLNLTKTFQKHGDTQILFAHSLQKDLMLILLYLLKLGLNEEC